MNWYVKTKLGRVIGPMTLEEAEERRDRLEGSMTFNACVFEPRFVTPPEVVKVVADLRFLASFSIPACDTMGSTCARAADMLILLSREKKQDEDR